MSNFKYKPVFGQKFDYLGAAAASFIYQDYINTHIDSLPPEVRSALPENYHQYNTSQSFYKENSAETLVFLNYFFENRALIEAWYKEQSKSYTDFQKEVLTQELMQLEIPNVTESIALFYKKEILREVVSVYDFTSEALKRADDYYLYLQEEQDLESVNHRVIKEITEDIRDKLFPIISTTVSELIESLKVNNSSSLEYFERNRRIITNLLLHANLQPVYDYAYQARKIEDYNDEQKASIIFYMMQTQYFLYAYIKNHPEKNYEEIWDELTSFPESCIYSSSFKYTQKVAYAKELLSLDSFRKFHSVYVIETTDTEDNSVKSTVISEEDNTNSTPVEEGKTDNENQSVSEEDLRLAESYDIYIQNLLNEMKLSALPKENLTLAQQEEQQTLLHQKKEFERTYNFYMFLKKGREIFGVNFSFDVLQSYIYLSLYRNKLNGKSETSSILLSKLINCIQGDIRNFMGGDEGKITVNDLYKIHQQNPEIIKYLIAFKKLFSSLTQSFHRSTSETQKIIRDNFDSIFAAIGEFETNSSTDAMVTNTNSHNDNYRYNYDKQEIHAHCCYRLYMLKSDSSISPEENGQIVALKFLRERFETGSAETDIGTMLNDDALKNYKTLEEKTRVLRGFLAVFLDLNQLGHYQKSRAISSIIKTEPVIGLILLAEKYNKLDFLVKKINKESILSPNICGESYQDIYTRLLKSWSKRLGESISPISISLRTNEYKLAELKTLRDEITAAETFLPNERESLLSINIIQRLDELKGRIIYRIEKIQPPQKEAKISTVVEPKALL